MILFDLGRVRIFRTVKDAGPRLHGPNSLCPPKLISLAEHARHAVHVSPAELCPIHYPYVQNKKNPSIWQICTRRSTFIYWWSSNWKFLIVPSGSFFSPHITWRYFHLGHNPQLMIKTSTRGSTVVFQSHRSWDTSKANHDHRLSAANSRTFLSLSPGHVELESSWAGRTTGSDIRSAHMGCHG